MLNIFLDLVLVKVRSRPLHLHSFHVKLMTLHWHKKHKSPGSVFKEHDVGLCHSRLTDCPAIFFSLLSDNIKYQEHATISSQYLQKCQADKLNHFAADPHIEQGTVTKYSWDNSCQVLLHVLQMCHMNSLNLH